MKIRQGFVSNSSSSSFIAIAVRVDINSVSKEDINSNYITFGKYLCDGVDLITINTEDKLNFFKIVKEYGCERSFTFYKLINSSYDESSLGFSKSDFKKFSELDNDDQYYEIIGANVDYHCSDDISTLLEEYCTDENRDKVLSILIRGKKLERIMK